MPRRSSTKHLKRPYEEGRLLEEVQKLNEAGVPFSDTEFPPTVSSLIDKREVPPFVDNVAKFTRDTGWKRAPDIWRDVGNKEGELQLFTVENLKPTAVKQGGLENCYFLASLTSLAKFPERVTRLFLPLSVNAIVNPGIYAVRMYCNGRPCEVLVDDWLPIKKSDTSRTPDPLQGIPKNAKITILSEQDNGDGTVTATRQIELPNGRVQRKKTTSTIETFSSALKFSKTSTEELWVSIVEKAYAKVQGTYASLEAGNHFETLRDLTGAPGFFYKSVEEHHWTLMEQYHANHFPMSCGIDYSYNMPHTLQALEHAGLLPMHAYSILAVAIVLIGGNRPQRLVKLRNPWGDAKEWTGAWSNLSTSYWNQDVRQQITAQGISLESPTALDGIFWMPWESFRQYFNSWDVNKYHDTHQFSAVILYDNPFIGYHLVTLHVQQPGQYTLGISQCSNRMMPPSAKYQYSSVRAILLKASANNTDEQENQDPNTQPPSFSGCTFIKGVVGEKRDEYIEMDNLQPGTYFVFVHVWWDASSRHLPTKDVSLNCYGPARVKFGQDVAPQYDRIAVLTEVFHNKIQAASDNDKAIVSKTRGKPHAANGTIMEYYNRNTCPEGYQFRIIANNDDAITLQEDKRFLSLQGAQLVKPTKNTRHYKVAGKDSYSISVGPGETKGVFLMVKSTFAMAGPAGKANLILADGTTHPEKESQQQQNSAAGMMPSRKPLAGSSYNPSAQAEPLTTLHSGGSRNHAARASGRRRSSAMQSIMASLRGSTTPGTPTPQATSSNNNAKQKRKSTLFGGIFGGGKNKRTKEQQQQQFPTQESNDHQTQTNPEASAQVPMSTQLPSTQPQPTTTLPSSPTTDQAPVETTADQSNITGHPEITRASRPDAAEKAPMAATHPFAPPAPASVLLSSPLPHHQPTAPKSGQQQQATVASAAPTMQTTAPPPSSETTLPSGGPYPAPAPAPAPAPMVVQTPPQRPEVSVATANKENMDELKTSAVQEQRAVPSNISHDNGGNDSGTHAPYPSTNPSMFVGKEVPQEEPIKTTKSLKSSKKKPGFFSRLFGGGRGRGSRRPVRKATPDEEKLLEKYPDLKGVGVLESTTTTTETVVAEEGKPGKVVSTTTVTSLRVLKSEM